MMMLDVSWKAIIALVRVGVLTLTTGNERLNDCEGEQSNEGGSELMNEDRQPLLFSSIPFYPSSKLNIPDAHVDSSVVNGLDFRLKSGSQTQIEISIFRFTSMDSSIALRSRKSVANGTR